MVRLWRSKESDVVCHGAYYQDASGKVNERRKERSPTVSVVAAAGDFHFSLLWTSAVLPRATALHVTCRHSLFTLDVRDIICTGHKAEEKNQSSRRAIREAAKLAGFAWRCPEIPRQVFGRMDGETSPRSRYKNNNKKHTIGKYMKIECF